MSRRQLPKPTQHKGSLTWEIRARIGGKIATRTLGTRDYDTALRRIPAVFDDLVRKHETKPKSVVLGVQHSASPTISEVVAQPIRLTISEVCARYRESFLASERQFRFENAQARHLEPFKLAADYGARLKRSLREAEAKAIAYDFENQEWWLNYLSGTGVGEVEDHQSALIALARRRSAFFAR